MTSQKEYIRHTNISQQHNLTMIERTLTAATSILLLLPPTHSFTFVRNNNYSWNKNVRKETGLWSDIVSPFSEDGSATATATSATELKDGVVLDLTEENVELVLDSMRSYLIADGGNVALTEIDGPVVKLELQVCIYVFVFYFHAASYVLSFPLIHEYTYFVLYFFRGIVERVLVLLRP